MAACHLVFSMGCDNMHLALDLLPPLVPRGGAKPAAAAAAGAFAAAALAGWGGLHVSDSNSSLASMAAAAGSRPQ